MPDEVIHRGYVIRPSPDPAPGGWYAKAMIFLHTGDKTHVTTVTTSDPKIIEDKDEAIRHSVYLGRAWVDQQEGHYK